MYIKHIFKTCLQIFAAVAAAVRCVLVSKKSMNVRDAARPLARRSGSGCSIASLLIACIVSICVCMRVREYYTHACVCVCVCKEVRTNT
jgi:hypothetical protein